jgi:hypothetical protein
MGYNVLPLSPEFSPDVTQYTLHVPYSSYGTTLTFNIYGTSENIQLQANCADCAKKNVSLAVDQAYSAIILTSENNGPFPDVSLAITITAQDGLSKTYSIAVGGP